jgi:hypothetical protein
MTAIKAEDVRSGDVVQYNGQTLLIRSVSADRFQCYLNFKGGYLSLKPETILAIKDTAAPSALSSMKETWTDQLPPSNE